MKKSLTLLLLLPAIMLSACDTHRNEADWENTLPSALAKTSLTEPEVFTDESKPPISISLPETTEPTSEKKTELATTTDTEGPDETEETTTASTTVSETEPPETETEDPFSGVSAVPVSNYNSTVAKSETTTAASSSLQWDTTQSPLSASGGESSSSAATSASDGTISSAPDKSGRVSDKIERPYCYSTLDERLRSLYDIVIKGITEHKDKVYIPASLKISKKDYETIYQMIYDSEHSVYYISTQMRYGRNVDTDVVVSADLFYSYTQDEIKTMQKKIDSAADKILAEVADSMSDYDIVKLFFDRLVEGCVYDLDAENCRDIYGCLANGRAVCGGYAKSFSYLCDRVGIQSITVTGDFEGIPHMWNMVKLGGEWYHIDVTSGFVDNASTRYIRYDYFCVDDTKCGKTHTPYEQIYSYPKAAAEKYNYFIYNGLVADNYAEVYDLLVEGLVSAASRGGNNVQILCRNAEVFDEAVYELFDKSRAKALEIFREAYDRADRKFNKDSIVYNQDRSTYVIKLFIKYTD